MGPEEKDISEMLSDLAAGDGRAATTLLPLVYSELRGLAEQYLQRERPGHTLQPTALVHEAYLRLVHQPQRTWEHRAHFLAVAAEAMRRVLVDHARTRLRAKRGGGRTRVPLDGILQYRPGREASVVAIDEAQFLDVAEEIGSHIVLNANAEDMTPLDADKCEQRSHRDKE